MVFRLHNFALSTRKYEDRSGLIGTPYKTVTKQKCINFKNDREHRGAQITVC